MSNHKFLWTARPLSLLLVSAVAIMAAIAAPGPAYSAKKDISPTERLEVRMDEEKRLAKMDKSYIKQQKALAEQYRNTAKIVQQQGGDPTALLEAAAYFDEKAK